MLKLQSAVLEATGTLAGVAYGAVAALMTLDIAVRGLDIGALAWLTELTEYVLYAATFLAAAWALRQGAHVRVDILLVNLRPGTARRLERATDAIGLAIAAVFFWIGTEAVVEAWRTGATQYKTWAVPEWLLLLPLPIAGLLLGVEFVLRLAGVPGTRRHVDPAQRASL